MTRGGAEKPADAHVFFARVLFYVLLAILATRPLISETFERVQISFLQGIAPPGGTTPATTAWLDFLLLIVAAATLLVRSAWRGQRWVVLSFATLVVAVLVSSGAAGETTVALRAGANFVITILGGLALITLIDARWMVRLTLAAVLATGVTVAWKCVNQQLIEFPETERFWNEEQKPKLLAQGVDPDDPLFVNYERRMLAREPNGFLGHPNVTASVLMMCLLVGVGVLAGRTFLRARPGLPKFARIAALGIGGGVLAHALVLTGSLGALGAAVGGGVLLLLLGVFAERIGRRPTPVIVVLTTAYLAVIAAGTTYGMAKGTLPHPSLAFRWWYWSAAGRAYLDAPLTGIGRENFAYAYMQYKPPESSEEVRNPHNLWLSLLVETGPLALAGGAVLGVLLIRRGLRSLGDPDASEPDTGSFLARAGPLVAGVAIVHVLFAGTPFAVPGIVLLWLLEIPIPWLVGCAAGWLLVNAVAERWLVAGALGALLGAFIHGLLGFALLTPAGLAVFVLCAAAAVGVLMAARETPPRQAAAARLLPGLLAVVTVVAYVVFVAWPTAATERAVQTLQDTLRNPSTTPRAVRIAADRVVHTYGVDAGALQDASRALVAVSRAPDMREQMRQETLAVAVDYAEAALRTNPRASTTHALLALVHATRAERYVADGDPDSALPHWQEAVGYWAYAVERYPTNPRTRISAGLANVRLWRLTHDEKIKLRAVEHLQRALAIDTTRAEGDAARLRAEELSSIDAALGEIGQGMSGETPDLPG